MADEPQILLRQEVRQATRGRFHQTMGELRSMAARMAAKGLTDDEEGYFRGLVAEYFLVTRQQTVELFGIEVAMKLLGMFPTRPGTEGIEEQDGNTASTG